MHLLLSLFQIKKPWWVLFSSHCWLLCNRNSHQYVIRAWKMHHYPVYVPDQRWYIASSGHITITLPLPLIYLLQFWVTWGETEVKGFINVLMLYTNVWCIAFSMPLICHITISYWMIYITKHKRITFFVLIYSFLWLYWHVYNIYPRLSYMLKLGFPSVQNSQHDPWHKLEEYFIQSTLYL